MSALWERLWYPESPETLARRALMLPLGVASWGFGVAVAVRNAVHDRTAPVRVPALKVISVGNLTVGGAGKTPVVIYLAQRLAQAGRRVAVLSRGYGRTEIRPLRVEPAHTLQEVGDEPLLIARRCPYVSVWVGAERAEIARRAAEEGADVALLDDGMQHRRLARDLEIVVVDESVGFGNGKLLPRGPLREPIDALRRAGLVWVRVGEKAQRLPSVGTPVVRARHGVVDVVGFDGTVHRPEALRGRRVIALSGIARPASFRRTLESLGAEVVGERSFSDHHAFSEAEVEAARQAAQELGADLVSTEKDQMRLPAGTSWVVRLGVEVLEGEAELARLLDAG